LKLKLKEVAIGFHGPTSNGEIRGDLLTPDKIVSEINDLIILKNSVEDQKFSTLRGKCIYKSIPPVTF
jgi:hypothetical protein